MVSVPFLIPRSSMMFEHGYAEPHPLVDAERKQFAAYLAGFAEDAR